MAFVSGFGVPQLRNSKTNVTRLSRTTYALSPRMGLRAIENYDGSFKLEEEVDRALSIMLLDSKLSEYVSKQARRECAEYMGILFQPVPYSVTTPHGMPKEVEQYYKNPDFAIINVPPQVMFKAKCYKPSRLCAVFRLQGGVREDPTLAQDENEGIDWSGIGDAIRNPVGDDARFQMATRGAGRMRTAIAIGSGAALLFSLPAALHFSSAAPKISADKPLKPEAVRRGAFNNSGSTDIGPDPNWVNGQFRRTKKLKSDKQGSASE